MILSVLAALVKQDLMTKFLIFMYGIALSLGLQMEEESKQLR
jgi:hypothetical protein